MSVEPVTRLTKQPREVRAYGFNFINYDEINKLGESIVEVLAIEVTPDTLTIPSLPGDAVINDEDEDGKEETITFVISGGDHGTTYKLTVLVETDAGSVLEADGELEVLNK